jgi:hypothetical protein
MRPSTIREMPIAVTEMGRFVAGTPSAAPVWVPRNVIRHATLSPSSIMSSIVISMSGYVAQKIAWNCLKTPSEPGLGPPSPSP